jgi:hypothetical protein
MWLQFREAKAGPPKPSEDHDHALRPWKGDGEFDRHPDWQRAMQREKVKRRATAKAAAITKPWQRGPSDNHYVVLKPWKDQKEDWEKTLLKESSERGQKKRDAFIGRESSEVNMPGRPATAPTAPNANSGWDPAYEIGRDVAEVQQLERDCSRRRVRLLLHTLQKMLLVGQHCQTSLHRVVTLEEELRRQQSREAMGTGSVASPHFPVKHLEGDAEVPTLKELLGAYRLQLTADLLFEPPPAGVDPAGYDVRLRVFGGPAASAGRPLLLPTMNELDLRELRRLLHLSTRLMVRLIVRALSDRRIHGIKSMTDITNSIKRLEERWHQHKADGGLTPRTHAQRAAGVLGQLCDAYERMFAGGSRLAVDEGSVGWRIFARVLGAVEGGEEEEELQDLFDAEDDGNRSEEGEKGEDGEGSRRKRLQKCGAQSHRLTNEEQLLAMELSHMLKSGAHPTQEKQQKVARVLKTWAEHAGADIFATGEDGADDDSATAEAARPPPGDADSDDIATRRQWAMWSLAQSETKAEKARQAAQHAAESLAAAEHNWLETMDDLKYYERQGKAISHRGGDAARQAAAHLTTQENMVRRAGELRDGALEAWRQATVESVAAAGGVSEAQRGAAEAGVSTVNPRMSTVEQRQAARDELWRRRQVARVLKTRRSADGRLEAYVRWRAHGPGRDSWEDAAALGLMEQGVVTPGLNQRPALQHDATGGIGAFLPVHYAH